MRAVRQCQECWVASFGGDGSPSNNCLERAVQVQVERRSMRVKSNNRETRLLRLRAAAQARR
jgi:hypothetical protein